MSHRWWRRVPLGSVRTQRFVVKDLRTARFETQAQFFYTSFTAHMVPEKMVYLIVPPQARARKNLTTDIQKSRHKKYLGTRLCYNFPGPPAREDVC